MTDRTLDEKIDKLAREAIVFLFCDISISDYEELANRVKKAIREALALRDAGEVVAWLYSEDQGRGKPFASTIPPSAHDQQALADNEVVVTPLYAAPASLHAVTVERCAKICDEAAREWRNYKEPTDFVLGAAQEAEALAKDIRQLAPETERVSVPREPTEEMYCAGLDYLHGKGTAWHVNDLYKAMLAAASGEK